jgi:hypothetical protein
MAIIPKNEQENIRISLLKSAVHNLVEQAYDSGKPREAFHTIADRMSGELRNPDAAEIVAIARDYPDPEKLEKRLSEHLHGVSQRVIDNPLYLRELLSLDTRHDRVPVEREGPIGEEVKKWSNDQKNVFAGLFFLHHIALGNCLFDASQVHAPEGYILGVKRDGNIIQKRVSEGSPVELYKEWLNISRHSVLFLGNLGNILTGDVEESLSQIVNDQERWNERNSYSNLPENARRRRSRRAFAKIWAGT